MNSSIHLYADVEFYIKNDGKINLTEFSNIYAKRPQTSAKWDDNQILAYNQIVRYLSQIDEFQEFHAQQNTKRKKQVEEYLTSAQEKLITILENLEQISKKEFGNEYGAQALEQLSSINDFLAEFSNKAKNQIDSQISDSLSFWKNITQRNWKLQK